MSKDAKKIVIVRKKKVAGGAHHGGSWKVAYADFVTAMMAFFMVMWILGMDDKLKQAIEGYFSNPIGYKKGYSAGASPISSGASPSKVQTSQLRMIVRNQESQKFNVLAQQLREMLAKNGELQRLGAKVEVGVTKEGLRIELIETGRGDVFFALGSAQMKPAAVIVLHAIAPELEPLPNPIVLEGHTDAASFGSNAGFTNWELSAERANAARRVLTASGLSPERVAEVRGLADRHLRVPENPLDPSNRRISVLLRYRDLGADEAAIGDSVPGVVAMPHAASVDGAPRVAPPRRAPAAASPAASAVPGQS
ncbi:Motility protein B, N-terminal domain protein [Gemmatirosa kalamazoonensis]|uniref:Motility protein B, N-terminal domain protein n=1 Tax=Gemmatirosa kalamazoonensis TaxID=861299 RepID=W0RBD8_9BACT|nr:flagellar motor protein MotB [Gemmatirosa kalamazoonensis]AHG87762.1 Motility protein B, N-terminal domain protein [Gemmatirosa kalamazoonensis]